MLSTKENFNMFSPAQDITSLEKIGPVVSFVKTDKAVTFNCRDNSQVQVTLLAPDLIRVRASFTKSDSRQRSLLGHRQRELGDAALES